MGKKIKPIFVDYPSFISEPKIYSKEEWERVLKLCEKLKEISKKYNLKTIPSIEK